MRPLRGARPTGRARQFFWREVATGDSPNDLKEAVPDLELRPGQRVRTVVQLTLPIADVINFTGVDFLSRVVWAQTLAQDHVDVDRVAAADSRTVVMEGTVTGTPLVPIVFAVAGLLGGAALFIAAISFFISPEALDLLVTLLPVGLLGLGLGLMVIPWGGMRR